jgi:exosome complex RNA-binding protein Rrp4
MIEVEINQTKPITVIMVGSNGEVWVSKSVHNLIPVYFSSPVVGRAK